MPVINVTFETQDQADAAMAQLRRGGIPFSPSYESNGPLPFPGGYVAHIVYPYTSSFSAQPHQQNPGYMIATNAISTSPNLSRETRVSVRLNSGHIDRAISVLRNAGGYSITQ